jgi:hypothetical protein
VATIANITSDIISLVNASGISGDDVLKVTVTVNPPGLMITCQQRDLVGDVIIEGNGEPLIVNLEPVAVSVDEGQLSDQT